MWFMGGGGGLWELIGKVHLCQDDCLVAIRHADMAEENLIFCLIK